MSEQESQPEENLEQDIVPVESTEEPGKVAAEADVKTHDKVPVPGMVKIVLLVACALAIFAVAASYALWTQQQQLRQQINGLIDTQVAKQLQQYAQQQQSALNAMQQQVMVTGQSNSQLSQSIQAMQTQLQQRVDNDINLIEAETLLRLASNEYELKHDIETSLLAMQMADAQLAEYSDQALVQVRESIEKEIKSLQQVVSTDLVAMMKEVGVLIKRVDTLPLISAQPRSLMPEQVPEETPKENQDLKQVLQGLMKKLQPLVTIRQKNHPTPPMLDVETERMVRMVLKVRYELIRQALLLRNQRLLNQSVKEARAWIDLYFDSQHSDIAHTLQSIENIASLKMEPVYPLIGVALQQLKAYRTLSRPQP